MNIVIVIPSPNQSPGLTNKNVPIPPPITLTDFNDQGIMLQAKRNAQYYFESVECLRRSTDDVTIEDVEEAEDFRSAVNIGYHMQRLLPFILPNIQSQQIQTTINAALIPFQLQLQNQLQVLETQLTHISRFQTRNDALLSNSFASMASENLIPPVVVNKNNNPTNIFPTSPEGIFQLEEGPELTEIEDYYDLPHEGSLQTRHQRICLAYGCSL